MRTGAQRGLAGPTTVCSLCAIAYYVHRAPPFRADNRQLEVAPEMECVRGRRTARGPEFRARNCLLSSLTEGPLGDCRSYHALLRCRIDLSWRALRCFRSQAAGQSHGDV